MKKNMIVTCSLLALLCCIFLILVFTGRKPEEKGTQATPTPNVVSNRYKLPNSMSYEYDEQEKCIILYGENLENPNTNTKDLRYSVMMKKNGEIIYESPVLKPGEKVENLRFPFDFGSGEHDIFLVSEPMRPDGTPEDNSIMTPLKIQIP